MADRRTRRALNALLVLHIFIFMAFLLSFARFVNVTLYNPFQGTNPLAVLLLWAPVLLAHVAAHAYFAGKTTGGGDSKAAYRQGFRDAVRDLSGADPERYGDRLALDDEDYDVYEPGEKPKRRADSY